MGLPPSCWSSHRASSAGDNHANNVTQKARGFLTPRSSAAIIERTTAPPCATLSRPRGRLACDHKFLARSSKTKARALGYASHKCRMTPRPYGLRERRFLALDMAASSSPQRRLPGSSKLYIIGRTPMNRLVAIVIFVLGVLVPLLVSILLLVGLK